MMTIVAPTLLPTKSESCEGLAVYNSQRVMRQLGYVQGTVRISEDMNTYDVIVVEAFIGKGKDQILAATDKLFRPALGRVGVSALYWQRSIEGLQSFGTIRKNFISIRKYFSLFLVAFRDLLISLKIALHLYFSKKKSRWKNSRFRKSIPYTLMVAPRVTLAQDRLRSIGIRNRRSAKFAQSVARSGFSADRNGLSAARLSSF